MFEQLVGVAKDIRGEMLDSLLVAALACCAAADHFRIF